ncbi:MAG: hypothetical protein QXZ44_01225 [Ferroplasma sp.]
MKEKQKLELRNAYAFTDDPQAFRNIVSVMNGALKLLKRDDILSSLKTISNNHHSDSVPCMDGGSKQKRDFLFMVSRLDNGSCLKRPWNSLKYSTQRNIHALGPENDFLCHGEECNVIWKCNIGNSTNTKKEGKNMDARNAELKMYGKVLKPSISFFPALSDEVSMEVIR